MHNERKTKRSKDMKTKQGRCRERPNDTLKYTKKERTNYTTQRKGRRNYLNTERTNYIMKQNTE